MIITDKKGRYCFSILSKKTRLYKETAKADANEMIREMNNMVPK